MEFEGVVAVLATTVGCDVGGRSGVGGVRRWRARREVRKEEELRRRGGGRGLLELKATIRV